jgi:hypothetical protein
MGSLYVDRGASAEIRQRNVNAIKERQDSCENSLDYPPLCVFVEGGTTNGTHIAPFKRGAF